MKHIIDQILKMYPKMFIKQIVDNNLSFTKENDQGFIEYKRTLSHCSENKMQQYASQMRWRISENIKRNIALYYIGLDDSGQIKGLDETEIIISVINFKKISDIIEASIKYIQFVFVNDKIILKICVKLKKNIQNCDFECI